MSGSHYFDPSPATRSAPRSVELALPDMTIELGTDRGVFSADRVDPGTKLLLLEAPRPPQSGELLDLGCGYGPIAAVLARRSPDAHVWAVDINARARALAEANTEALGNVTVAAPDAVPDAVRFAALYANPPVRVGKDLLHALLSAWLPRSPVAYLVVNKHLGADSLARWMSEDRSWAVERLASRVAYRILEVRP
jgi:16S rRNA (guanine1207-N2)-methyltransferase